MAFTIAPIIGASQRGAAKPPANVLDRSLLVKSKNEVRITASLFFAVSTPSPASCFTRMYIRISFWARGACGLLPCFIVRTHACFVFGPGTRAAALSHKVVTQARSVSAGL